MQTNIKKKETRQRKHVWYEYQQIQSTLLNNDNRKHNSVISVDYSCLADELEEKLLFLKHGTIPQIELNLHFVKF